MESPPDTRPARETDAAAARAAIESNSVWYHTIELAPGVVTPGQLDWRGAAGRVLPEDLRGRRALDVGTFDGFWAFEMERRGADVVAIDVETVDAAEWPPLNRPELEAAAREWELELGKGFRLAAEVLDSSVERVVSNVYDLAPEIVGGPVDLAFVGSILIHLRDPIRALERVRETLAPGGTVIVVEPISIWESILMPTRPVARFEAYTTQFNWWRPNLALLGVWLRAAGFVDVRRLGLHRPPVPSHRPRQRYAAYAGDRADHPAPATPSEGP